MSQENVEIVKRLYDAWNRRDEAWPCRRPEPYDESRRRVLVDS